MRRDGTAGSVKSEVFHLYLAVYVACASISVTEALR